ncbi:MAG: hypothetical protein DMD88_10700 [Candidatus Rokuibacteriota bacterium]|nr:MAG: hypothetical protein DMD88_10700 [Candidatus Rokubacteria bacterium]
MARVATNVRLDAAQLHRLRRLALERGVSLSTLFQELIADYLVRVSTLTPCPESSSTPGQSRRTRRPLMPSPAAPVQGSYW